MKLAIVVRHGLPGTDGRLSKHGRAQMEFCAHKISQLCGEKQVRVMSSVEECALESATVITKKVLNARLGSLSPKFDHQEELSRALEWLESDEACQCEVGIIVTHGETGDSLLAHLYHLYGIEGKPEKLENAEACVLENGKPTTLHIKV